MNEFENVHFCVRKYLLSFFVGEERLLPVSKCKYANIKSNCSQLKAQGVGEWKVTKKFGGGDCYTRIIRVK